MKRTGITALLLLGAVGCKGASARQANDASSDQTAREKIARMMAREQGPFAQHEVSLFDGRIEGEVESKSKPRVECEQVDDTERCTVTLDMGVSETGKPSAIACVATNGHQPFGQQIHALAPGVKVFGRPEFDARKEPQGLSGHFSFDGVTNEKGQPTLMSLKVSSLYSGVYTFTCLDLQPGGKQTFARVVRELFASLSFGDPPEFAGQHSLGYVKRQGDEATGFRFVHVGAVDGEQVQSSLYFNLKRTKEQWQTVDRDVFTLRSAGGELTKYQSRNWLHGLGPVVITAKPAEDGKLRIKVDNGNKSDALEITPRAAVSTEERMAPQLASLRSRTGRPTRYGFPALDADGDPTLLYSVLEHHEPGIVYERVVSHADFNQGSRDEPSELHVDEHGVVTRQVNADEIIELVHRRGTPSASQKVSQR